jgi:hypothetical protein
MVKFFNNIRYRLIGEGNINKYFRYALGEIVLVMIGILLAIQVNNWNESQKIQKRIQVYSKSLIDDLQKDIDEATIRKEQISWKSQTYDSVFSFFRNKKIDEINNVDVVFTLGYYINYRALSWQKGSIDELKNSGNLHSIKNDSLKRAISNYYSFLDHLGEDYIVDLRLANVTQDKVRTISNLNYPKQLLDSIRSVRSSKPFNEWFNSSTYSEALGYNYGLLTKDINDIYVILNQLEQLDRSFGHRLVEYNQAISYATQIISMLEEIYGQN